MNYLRDLIHRLRARQSERAIGRDLGLSRVTVHKYRLLAERLGLLDSGRPLPEAKELQELLGPAPKPPQRPSGLEAYRELVEEMLQAGLEMTTIYDRLRDQHGYTGSYSSVRRFVGHLRPEREQVYVRLQTRPGEEAQVDFGSAGSLYDPASGRYRQGYLFVMTLSFSRHQYAEIVLDQRIATWLSLHRHAFESFGGVPGKVVLDNLKAAVLQAHLHDPLLGEAYRRFAQHYGFIVSPNRPGTPRHKGKVENGIHYAKRSFLAGQEFSDLAEANRKLGLWVREKAGAREHGTTHQAPLALFLSQEQQCLRPLPAWPFDLCETRGVKVHNDCHVTIDGSYYSVPYAYVGQTLEAFLFERIVQLFHGTELVASHPRAQEKGQWLTRPEHYPAEKAAYLEGTAAHCQQRAETIGPSTAQLVRELLAERPQDRLRSVHSLLRLGEKVGGIRLEAACRRALYFGDGHYRRVKDILNAGLESEPLPEQEVEEVAPANVYVFQRQAAEFFSWEVERC
jgi:transposase